MADAAQLKTRIEKAKNQLKGKTQVVTKARRTKKTLKRLQRRLKLVLIQGKKIDEQKAKHGEHLKKKTEKAEKRTLREAAEKEAAQKRAEEKAAKESEEKAKRDAEEKEAREKAEAEAAKKAEEAQSAKKTEVKEEIPKKAPKLKK